MRRFWWVVLLMVLFGVTLSGCGASSATQAAYVNISVSDLQAKLSSGEPLLLLDVRSPEEFANDGHIAQAVLIPLPELGQRLNEIPKDVPIACICRSGNRSQSACQQLTAAGYTPVYNVVGGMGAWIQAGLPTQ